MEHGKRIMILIVLLLAALGCYVIGLHLGALLFIVAGVLLECAFWLHLFNREQKK